MTDENKPLNFIQQIMSNDLKESVVNKIITRFPPEPNGYLHIGHAKSICLNFGLAEQFEGMCHLRFDDTNPEKENEEFVKSIIEDIEWLGFKWDGDIRYASDYFDQFYIWAKHLIMKNKAYVCELNSEEMKESRGTITLPGTNSPYRDRSIDSSIQLLERWVRVSISCIFISAVCYQGVFQSCVVLSHCSRFTAGYCPSPHINKKTTHWVQEHCMCGTK